MVSIYHVVVPRDNYRNVDLIEDVILYKAIDSLAVNLLLRWAKLSRLPCSSVALNMIGLSHELCETSNGLLVVELRHIFPRDSEVAGADISSADAQILLFSVSGRLTLSR